MEGSLDPVHGVQQDQKCVICRPPFQLRALPILYRWEVTRRHPYYQDWWKTARSHHQNEPVRHPAEPYFRQAAVAILAAIGVSGAPPDPMTEFGELESENLNPAWVSGCVHPITLRGIAAILVAGLPKETLGYVGLKLVEAGCDDKDGDAPRKIQALNELCTLHKPGLDAYPDEPIVSINPAASGRKIEDALSQLLRQWKAERELMERRDRSDKYSDYLHVWDLREGWNAGHYDRGREKRLRDVAAELKLGINTIHNHYRAAFELIAGHPYSPELWWRLFGPLKLSKLYGPMPGPVSRARPTSPKVGRDIPETVVRPTPTEGHALGLIAGRGDGGDHAFRRLLNDIRQLLAAGRSDEEIVEELELSDAAIDAVAYLRERDEDLL